jgi:hypothetical protein
VTHVEDPSDRRIFMQDLQHGVTVNPAAIVALVT